MIVYYDSGGRLFTAYFKENGQECVQQLRYLLPGSIGRCLCRKTPLALMLRRFPDVDPSDGRIIVFDTRTPASYIEKLRHIYPEKEIVFWFWNPVNDNNRVILDRVRKIVPVWSYSPDDCRQYDLKYNTQFYFDSLIPEQFPETHNAVPKAFFLGRSKSARAHVLDRIISELQENGVEVESIITKPRHKDFRQQLFREKLIPYSTVLEKTRNADILIDCYGRDRAGCSLRVMEAMFFGKKLITDNLALAEYDFYDSHNIYITGKDNRSLKEFIEVPVRPVPEEIRNRYRFSAWLERFSEKD